MSGIGTSGLTGGDDTVELHADRGRRLHQTDPEGPARAVTCPLMIVPDGDPEPDPARDPAR